MKLFPSLIVSLALLISVSAQADFKPYTKAEYDTALQAGKTVVVDFHAPWCPTCRKQAPLLNEIVNMPGYENVVALKADYDQEKDLKKNLKVSKQSTVVVFKGGKEVARKTGATAKDELKMLIDMGL